VAAGFRRYRALEPGPWFKAAPEHEFVERYFAEALAPLDANKVLDDLLQLANGTVPVLCCWEHPPPDPAWCHRGLVSAWFKDQIGLDVPELGHEHKGCGWSHPKLASRLKASIGLRS
jgi:hypothetical protein